MTINLTDLKKFNEFYYGLSSAVIPKDMLDSWRLFSKENTNYKVILSFPYHEKDWRVMKISEFPEEVKGFVCSYFSNDKLMFIDEEINKKYSDNQTSGIKLLPCVYLDSNFSSYIGTLFNGGNLLGNSKKVEQLLNKLLSDNITFDFFLYLTENIKHMPESEEFDSPLIYWRKLSKRFKKNLIALEFISCQQFDNLTFALGSYPKSFKISLIRRVVKNTFDFYVSKKGKKISNKFLFQQKETLLLLIGIYIVQFSSNKGVKQKLSEFLKYMFDNLGRFFQTETIVAILYFLNQNSIKFFGTINKGNRPKNLIDKLDNMAWDMVSVRFLENFISLESNEYYLIPFFLSIDEGLLDLYGFYKAKGIIINKNTNVVHPIPNNVNDYILNKYMSEDIKDKYFSNYAREERLNNIRDINIDTAINEQLKILENLFVLY